MARTDDFRNALALALEKFRQTEPRTLATNSGANLKQISAETYCLSLKMFEKKYDILWPEGQINMPHGVKELSLPEQVLLFRYLINAKDVPIKGVDITFRQVPGGNSYFPAFVKRAQGPMTDFFGSNPSLLLKIGLLVGGKKGEAGDASIIFDFFPRVPVQLVIWAGDEEFAPEGSILFDETITQHLSSEDIAVMSGMIVFNLISLAKAELNKKEGTK